MATTGDCLYSEECAALCSGGGCAVPGTGDGGGSTREASTAREASGPQPDAAACTHHCDDTGGGKCACKMFCGSDMYAADCDPATKACLCNPGNQAADCGTAELCSGASAFDNVGACCKFPGF